MEPSPSANQLIRLAIIMHALSSLAAASNLHPVILVPGAGGNQLEARLNKDYKSSSFFCDRWYPLRKQSDGWFRLWFDPSVLLPPFTDCYAQRMTTFFDMELDDFRNAPGVETRVPHFGSLRSLLYLDPSLKASAYMAALADTLEGMGYISDESLFGAPYDFRYGLPSTIGIEFLDNLRGLVEKASARNGGKKVIIMSHSLGGLFILQFLNRMPLPWRTNYIKHFIALSSPWGGTAEQIRTFASGNTLGVPLVDPSRLRRMQRSSESNLWLLPNPEIFGGKELLSTPNRTYSAHDIEKFLEDIGFAEGVYPYRSRVLPLTVQLKEPEVPVTCVVGGGVETTERLIYKGKSFDERPEVLYGDGDGTVNMESLMGLKTKWGEEGKQFLRVVSLRGISHTDILTDERALRAIAEEISTINSATSALSYAQ